jgi:two-component system CheB/CheR fusion protein
MEYKAMHDANTGLPNRFLFQDRIKRSFALAKRYKSRLAVLFIKIERKNIKTDELGRRYGDQILKEVAKRLTSAQRGSDTLAYIGKNKFAVILENITGEGNPDMVSNRILALLSEPIRVERLDVQVQIKINICMDTDGLDNLEARCKAEIEGQYIPQQKTEAINPNG